MESLEIAKKIVAPDFFHFIDTERIKPLTLKLF